LPDRITIDDAMSKVPAAKRGITFDEALAARDAATTVTVDSPERIQAAEALAKKYPDPRSIDPTTGLTGDTSVGIEQFVHTNAPPILPPEDSNFTAQLKSDFVTDPETKRKLIAKSLFPNDPNGHQRVGMIDDTPVYVDDKGQLRKVANGWERFAASAVANSPEAIVGGIGSLAAYPVAGGALGAAGAHGIKRGIAGLLTDEPQTVQGNLTEMAGEGVVNTAAGLIGKGVGAVAGRGKIVDFTPNDVKSAVQARDYIKASTGIDTDLAQASGNRKLIALRAYAARYPGKSAELVQAAEEAQKGQLDTAVGKVLDNIAKSAPSEVSGGAGINAAGMVLELARGARDKAVEPFYTAAGKVRLPADVVTDISTDPLIARAAKQVAKDPVYQRKLADAAPDSVAYWHQVKRNLDAGYSTASASGNKTAAREYADAAKQVNEKLKAASPEYAQANDHYATVTRDTIEPLENSAIGTLSRITSPKAATAAARILSDPNVSAAEIRATMTSLNKIDPEIGPGLVRQWIGQEWNRALKETQTGAEVNAAGKLRQAIYGTPEARAKADAMIPQSAKQAFTDLMDAAQSLARTPSAGSNTTRDLNIEGQLKGQGGVLLKWLTQARSAATAAAEGKALEKNTLALTEALLDPAKQKQLKVIVKMSDPAKKAIALSTLLGWTGYGTSCRDRRRS
jgi:hypothetical protein